MTDLRDIDLSRLLTLYAVHGGTSRCLDAETAERLENAGLVALERSDGGSEQPGLTEPLHEAALYRAPDGWIIETRITQDGERAAIGMLAAARVARRRLTS